MKYLINYADSKYKQAQYWNTWSGIHIGGFDYVYQFGPENIDEDYRLQHSNIFSYKRGNGLWLWKPYFINKVLNDANDGDYIFYSDSGSIFIRNVDIIINSMKKDDYIWISDNPLLEKSFTKKSCFELMDCNEESYKESNQIQATYLMIKNNESARNLMNKWLKWCEDVEAISPQEGVLVNDEYVDGFVAHREDQSILSLLCKKEKIVVHKDPSQRGNYPETFYNEKYEYIVPIHENDKYKPILFLHKFSDISILKCLKVYGHGVKCKIKCKRM